MFKKNTRNTPKINTSALPDIIFMLLFFFMTVTVLRLPESDHVIDIPRHNYVENQKEKRDANFIFMALAPEKTIVQINENKVDFSGIDHAFVSLKSLSTKNAINYLKIDKNMPMLEVNKLKTSLRKAELRNVVYVLNQE